MADSRSMNMSAINQARMAHIYVTELLNDENEHNANATNAKSVIQPLELLLLDVIGDELVSLCRYGTTLPRDDTPTVVSFAAITATGLVRAQVSTSSNDDDPGYVEMLPWATLESWGFRFPPGHSSGALGRMDAAPARCSLSLRFRGRAAPIDLEKRTGGVHALKYTYPELLEILDVARRGANAVE